MAKTDIEITADAKQAEATFDKLNQKQKKQVEGFQDMAAAGVDSSRQVAAANEAAANKGTAAYDRVLRELRKQGPEGRAQAKAIEGHLRDTGKAGRRSMAAIVTELGTFELWCVSTQTDRRWKLEFSVREEN